MTQDGVVSGSNIILSVNGVPVGCSTDAKISIDRAVLEASCKESGDSREVSLGTLSWEMSTDNLYKIGSDVDMFDFYTLLLNKTVFEVSWGTNLTGDRIFTGTAVCPHVEASGPVADAASFSATLTGTGQLIVTTLPSPY